MNKLLTLVIIFIAVIMLRTSRSVYAQPQFIIDEPLTFTYPPPGVQADQISFMVFSSEGVIRGVEGRIREIKNPDGQLLPIDAFRISASSDTVTPAGTRYLLTVDRDYLEYPGEYLFTFLLEGRTARGESIKSSPQKLILKRSRATINLEELKGRTIKLMRWFPGMDASKNITLTLFETSGKSDLPDLTASGQEIYREGKKEQVPGEVIVNLSRGNMGGKTHLPAGGELPIQVKFSGLEDTGAFETSLIVNSPALGERIIIPLKLSVTDFWLLPLIIILLGVTGGFATNFLSEKWRPRQQNNYHLLRLKGEANGLNRVVRDPETVAKLQPILDNLIMAEEKNDQGDAEGAKVLLETIEKDLMALRQEQGKLKAETLQNLKRLRQEINLYRESLNDLSEDERRELNDILQEVKEVESRCLMEQVDDAKTSLEETEQQFTRLKKQRITDNLDELKKIFESLGTIPDALKEEAANIENQFAGVETLLSEDKLPEAHRALTKLNAELNTLTQKVKGRRGRQMFVQLQHQVGKFFDMQQSERPAPGIEILDEPASRTSDISLHFHLTDPAGQIPADAQLRWDFGDGQTLAESDRSAIHRYRRSGNYQVMLTVSGSKGAVLQRLSEFITVLPGQSERQRTEIRRDILKTDLALYVIALVLAALTGLLYLYVDKTFGSLEDYLLALLWGFGIDNSVRGFSAVLKKISGS